MFANLRDDKLLLGIDQNDATGEGAMPDRARTKQKIFGPLRVPRSARLYVPDPVQPDSLVLDESADAQPAVAA